MAGTYPPLLAGGVDNIGRFDQFDLYAGESDVVTSQAQAADGVAIQQFQVLEMDIDGRLVPWDASEFSYATGTLTFAANPANNDTVTINGVVITFVTSGATGPQVNIGTLASDTANNLAALLNGTPDGTDPYTLFPTYGTEPLAGTGITAVAASNVVSLYAVEPGTPGNAITLAKSGTNPAVSAATLAGGAAETDVVPKKAIGIAAQAAPATTPGTWFPYFTGGVFNHQVLVWPPGVSTLGQRKRAFAGSDINVGQLL